MKRSHVARVALTDWEQRQLQDLAEAAGESCAATLRRLIRAAHDRLRVQNCPELSGETK